MKRYEPGSLDDRSDFYEVDEGIFVMFEDVQQLAREVLSLAFRNCDDHHQCDRCEMYRKLKSIAEGTP